MVGLQPGLPSPGFFWELLEKVPRCGTILSPVSPTPTWLTSVQKSQLREILGHFSYFGSFTINTLPSPPIGALGIAETWKILFPTLLHYPGPSLSKWPVWLLPSPCSPPRLRLCYAITLMLQSVPAEPNQSCLCWHMKCKGEGRWSLGTWEGRREEESPSDPHRVGGVDNDIR